MQGCEQTSNTQLISELNRLKTKCKNLEEVSLRQQRLERELHRVNRALATVSTCQKVMVQSKQKADLLNDICRVIVDVGGYPMAWVGVAKRDEKRSIQPLGFAGDYQGFYDKTHLSWYDSDEGFSPAARVMSSGKPYIINDILSAPELLSWRGEALKRGFGSMIVLPLTGISGPVGALTIFSSETNVFNERETSLLEELCDNLVYGIRALHTRTEKFRAETEVKNGLNKLRQALGAIIEVLEQTVEIRDPYTAGHQRRVADLARSIAEEMELPNDRIDGIRIAGIIHDIGKIYVPAEILSKPRSLSTLEFSLIKTHPQIGYDILKTIDFPWPVADIVLQHHERCDGSGYPHELKSDDILLEAKILGIADVVEAMASHRPYRPALGIDRALDEIRSKRGALYEPEIVDICLKLFHENNFEFKDVSFTF